MTHEPQTVHRKLGLRVGQEVWDEHLRQIVLHRPAHCAWWGEPASSTLGGMLRVVWPWGPGFLRAVPSLSGAPLWAIRGKWIGLPGDDAERREHPLEAAGMRCWLHQCCLADCGCPTIQEALRPTMGQKLGDYLPLFGWADTREVSE